MSAALVLLPQHPGRTRPTGLFLAAAASPIAVAAAAVQDFHEHGRKGPHTLRLLQACAEPAVPTQPRGTVVQMPLRVQPELALYRIYTEAMLRRYASMSMEAGRVPSLLGQEMFRGRISNCRVTGFDDVVIFVEDVNKCLALLDAGQRLLIRRIAVEGYTQQDTAAMHGIALRTVYRRYEEAIDRLSRIFLDRKLLNPLGDSPTA